jgi:hypothetical protein
MPQTSSDPFNLLPSNADGEMQKLRDSIPPPKYSSPACGNGLILGYNGRSSQGGKQESDFKEYLVGLFQDSSLRSLPLTLVGLRRGVNGVNSVNSDKLSLSLVGYDPLACTQEGA